MLARTQRSTLRPWLAREGVGGRAVRFVRCCSACSCSAVAPAASHAQIVVDDVRASEGSGSLTFTVARQAGLLAPAVSVAFRTQDGSAVAPADYGAVSGSLNFPGSLFGGAQQVTVTVPVTGDGLDEDDEAFRLVISGSEVSDGEGIGTIADDDAAAGGERHRRGPGG